MKGLLIEANGNVTEKEVSDMLTGSKTRMIPRIIFSEGPNSREMLRGSPMHTKDCILILGKAPSKIDWSSDNCEKVNVSESDTKGDVDVR